MTAELAAQLAPELDRLALCVHRPAGRDPSFRALVVELQLPAGSIVVTAARQVVAGRVTLADVELLNRYESRTLVALNMRHQVDLGFLRVVDGDGHADAEVDGDGEAFAPSDAFRRASEMILQLQADAAATLWADCANELPAVAALAAGAVECASARASVPTPAFAGQVAHHHVLPSTPAAEVLGHITELRYLRADLHAAVLGRHGLAGPRARALGRLWKGYGLADDHGVALEKRGLVARDEGAWALTDTGRSVRDEVELDTNVLTARALPTTDMRALLDAFRDLDGDDPRPPEDR
jgi:hypothetical protein